MSPDNVLPSAEAPNPFTEERAPVPPNDGPSLTFRSFLRRNRKLLFWVAVIQTVIFVFIFRDVLLSLPSVWRGESVIGGDELVPFFDVKTQFIDQIMGQFSPLTHQYEFRIRYALLTTWMRYFLLLPFTVFFVPLFSSFLLTVIVSYFLQRVTRRFSPAQLIRGAALSSLLFQFILLYSKVTHFYSLVFGFTLFTTSIVLVLLGLCYEEEHPLRLFLIACIMAVCNPAVHYIVLFVLVVSFLSLGSLILRPFPASSSGPDRTSRSSNWRVITLLVLTLVVVVIPYALLVKYFFLRGLGDLEEQVPVNYELIRTGSVPLLAQLSFDISSILNNIFYGDYTLVQPRYAHYAYFLLFLVPLLPGVFGSIAPERRERRLLWLLYALFLFSLWCALGYASADSVITFHRFLSMTVDVLVNIRSSLTWNMAKVLNALVEVLRFPHRFQFLTFSVVLVLLPLGIAWLEDRFAALPWKRSVGSLVALSFLFFVPLFCDWDFRFALFSGDLGGFLHPYPLAALSDIRTQLRRLPEGKTIVIPPVEAAKRITAEDGAMHKFIDKFYIYYLDVPSHYYGLDSTVSNKIDFFLFYRALLYGEYWWINVLREQGIRYIIINKELGPNPIGGVEYLKGIEDAVAHEFPRASFVLKPVYENRSFTLYEFTDDAKAPTKNLYFDVPWDKFVCYQQSALDLSKQYQVLYNPKIINASNPTSVVTDDPKKASYDLYVKTHPEAFTTPDNTTIPFDENVLPSTFYSGNIFSMETLLRASKYNYFNIILPGVYDTLTGTFMGMKGPSTLHFHMSVPAVGSYQVLLRVVSTKNRIHFETETASIDRTLTEADSHTQYFWRSSILSSQRKAVDVSSHTIEQLQDRIPDDIVPVGYQFDYISLGTLQMQKGTHHVTLTKRDGNPLIVEGLLLLPESEGTQTLPLPPGTQLESFPGMPLPTTP
jgi:hypothetical protein